MQGLQRKGGENKMARRTKLTKELIEEAYKLVSEGNYDKDVYPILGIGEVTWYRWLREGEIAKRLQILQKTTKIVVLSKMHEYWLKY